MFTAYVLPKLEYACEIWSPFLVRDIDVVERVLCLFTRRLPGMQGKSYDERLRILHWSSLQSRRIYKDIVMVYKIIHGIVDLNFDDFFEYADYLGTRYKGASV